MRDLMELYRYNAWANDLVFACVARQDVSLSTRPAPGTVGTLTGTLAHLTMVEDAYWHLWQRQEMNRDGYLDRGLDWFRSRCAELGVQVLRALEGATEASLERDLEIPWFDFPVSVREGLHQVLVHSQQHRSQVLSWLGAQGVEVPIIDYVAMLQERGSR